MSWFINEEGEPYSYDAAKQADEFPNDDHIPYATKGEALAAAARQVPKHEYEMLTGTRPKPYVEHAPRTMTHSVVRAEGTDLHMMTEIGDGTFVAWSECRRCSKRVAECKCAEGPKEAGHMERWRHERFKRELNARPDPDYPLLDSVLKWARERGHIVTSPSEIDMQFVRLFEAVAACEAPPGTQVDEVLKSFQQAYSNLTGSGGDRARESVRESERVEHEAGDDLATQMLGDAVAAVREASGAIERPEGDVTEDDLDFARETLGDKASQDEVMSLAQERVTRDARELTAERLKEDHTDVGF